MNYTILWTIGIALIVLGLAFGVPYIMKRFNFKKEDILNDVDMSQGVLLFIKIMLEDMNFGDKATIEKTVDIISQSLDYIKILQETDDKKDKIKLSTAFAANLCTQNNIELNKDRLYILNTIIITAYNMFYSLEENNNIK